MSTNFNEISDRSSGNFTQNIVWHTQNYSIEAVIRNTRKLIVTFEPANQQHTRPPERFREGWGHAFLRSCEYSALYVKPMAMDWYRQADLVSFFEKLNDLGFFQKFEETITYGASMGGFAALVFANLIGAKKVIALQPQTTLDLRKVPWETRFREGLKYDWASTYSDVSDHLRSPVNAFIIYDRWFRPDSAHVDRICDTGANICRLNVPFVGHNIPKQLVDMKALRPLFLSIVEDRPFLHNFQKDVRKRRNSAGYYSLLEERPRVKESKIFSTIVCKFRERAQPTAV